MKKQGCTKRRRRWKIARFATQVLLITVKTVDRRNEEESDQREGVKRRGGKTNKRIGPKYPAPHVQYHCHSVPNVCTPCVQGCTCLKGTVLRSSPLLGSPSSTESPRYKWLVARKRNKEETVPGGQSPQRQGQTTRPANGTRRQDKAPKAPTSTTHQGTSDHTRKADKPGNQETFQRLKSNTEAEPPPLYTATCFTSRGTVPYSTLE